MPRGACRDGRPARPFALYLEDTLHRPTPRPPSTSARHIAALAILILATLVGGCGEAKADRERAEAARKAEAAIAAYSAASQEANALHGEVIRQFGKANAATNLPDYREAMRRDVLPAMDRFVARLKGMPVNTPELKRIHGGLITAYADARRDIATFVDQLQSARDLSRFGVIRKRLQQRVGAYQSDLAAYYKNWNRKLRDGAPKPADQPASGQTAPAAPAEATATTKP